MAFDPHSPVDLWPEAIGFVPFVGPAYESGIAARRVLLLGESHYLPDDNDCDPAHPRAFTRCIFEACATEVDNRAWPRFFRRCDAIVARHPSPAASDAAEAWRHIAFANLVQSFVGNAARQRPTRAQWAQCPQAFDQLMACLRPDVVLALGRGTWNNTPDRGERVAGIPSVRGERDVWRMPYDGGEALMTWVYHPSTPRESATTSIAVFEALLALPRAR